MAAEALGGAGGEGSPPTGYLTPVACIAYAFAWMRGATHPATPPPKRPDDSSHVAQAGTFPLMDARQRRSRAALRAAVLELAAETPIAEITATDIAAAAGVHRTTFYQHAASPVDLLLDALGAEIDEARQRTLADHPETNAAAAIDDVSRAVLEHIDHHAAVYRRGLGPESGGGSLHRMLGDHFLTSIRLLREQGRIGDAPVPPGADHDYIQATSDRHHADGAAGAIAVWLDLPEPRSIDTFLQVLDVIQPPWWPRA